tara:strand:+ start:1192 stop:1737 length:546 start_codon:yes stop_codon:yes gene_type:complete
MSNFKRRFSKLKNADANKRGKHFLPGLYLLTVEKSEMFESQNPKKKGHDMHATNFKVEEFRGERYYDFKRGEDVTSEGMFQKGTSVNAVYDWDDEWGYGVANSKELIVALILEMDNFSEESEEAVFDAFDDPEFEEQLNGWLSNGSFVGLQLVATVQDVGGENKNFFKPSWTPASRSNVFR